MSDKSAPKADTTSLIVQNWHLHSAGDPLFCIYEFPLYTDAHITGEIQHEDWPYSFLNTVPMHNEAGLVQASIVLRVKLHISSSDLPDMTKTDTSQYHGGLLWDEIAALVSLCTGARMEAGGESRRFDNITAEPFGRPVAWDRKPKPHISLTRNRLVLPDVIGSRSLDKIEKLNWLLKLTPLQTIALIRAARLYQDALWIAESNPALAWLMFISALETAANHWKSENGTPIERLNEAKPDLLAALKNAGGDSLAEFVANQIEQSLGATKKFIDFSLKFLPNPPPIRPSPAFQIDWSESNWKKTLSTVYSYRSRALHGGIPFPAPMCELAFKINNSEGFAERGTIGLAASSRGGVWVANDLPINLHTFHYFTQNVLLRWWEDMSTPNSDGSTNSQSS